MGGLTHVGLRDVALGPADAQHRAHVWDAVQGHSSGAVRHLSQLHKRKLAAGGDLQRVAGRRWGACKCGGEEGECRATAEHDGGGDGGSQACRASSATLTAVRAQPLPALCRAGPGPAHRTQSPAEGFGTKPQGGGGQQRRGERGGGNKEAHKLCCAALCCAVLALRWPALTSHLMMGILPVERQRPRVRSTWLRKVCGGRGIKEGGLSVRLFLPHRQELFFCSTGKNSFTTLHRQELFWSLICSYSTLQKEGGTIGRGGRGGAAGR